MDDAGKSSVGKFIVIGDIIHGYGLKDIEDGKIYLIEFENVQIRNNFIEEMSAKKLRKCECEVSLHAGKLVVKKFIIVEEFE